MLQQQAPMDSIRLRRALLRTTPDAKADNKRWKRLLDKPRRTLFLASGTDGWTGLLGCRKWENGGYSIDLHAYSSYVAIPKAIVRGPVHEVSFHTLLSFVRKVQRMSGKVAFILSIDPDTDGPLDIRVAGKDWTVQSIRHLPASGRPRLVLQP